MDLRRSYTLFAPFYDLVLRRVSAPLRRSSLAALGEAGKQVLIAGIGSGLDLPHLPKGNNYVGIDLTPAMLRRAQRHARSKGNVALHQGNVMALPYADRHFDVVVMHLILAVVPQPALALREAARVLKPNGEVLILDKFLRPGERAPVRKTFNVFTRSVATRLDVVFEDVLACCPDLRLESDVPAVMGGWFRYIRLRKVGHY